MQDMPMMYGKPAKIYEIVIEARNSGYYIIVMVLCCQTNQNYLKEFKLDWFQHICLRRMRHAVKFDNF
jgi:hypothetical protein